MNNTNYKKEYEDLRNELWRAHNSYSVPWHKEWSGIITFLLLLLELSLLTFVPDLRAKIVGIFFFVLFLLFFFGIIFETIKNIGRREAVEWADRSLEWRRLVLKEGKDKRLIEFFSKKNRPTEEETEAFFVAPKLHKDE